MTHIKCVGTPQWPTLGLVEALIYGLEGGGDNGGQILRMCTCHLLVASYSGPKIFALFWCIKKFSAYFPL